MLLGWLELWETMLGGETGSGLFFTEFLCFVCHILLILISFLIACLAFHLITHATLPCAMVAFAVWWLNKNKTLVGAKYGAFKAWLEKD